jgi:hypothetical protein
MELAIVILSFGVAIFAVLVGMAIFANSGHPGEEGGQEFPEVFWDALRLYDLTSPEYQGVPYSAAVWARRVAMRVEGGPGAPADDFRTNMLQVAALALRAVEADDREREERG